MAHTLLSAIRSNAKLLKHSQFTTLPGAGCQRWKSCASLFRYRNLILQTVRRNLVIRYKRSVLGIAWTMLNPLGTTLILTFVFSNVFGGVSHYAPYVLSGLLCWTFFSQTTSDSMANSDLGRRSAAAHLCPAHGISPSPPSGQA